jgi:hypothetical protein
MHSGITGEAGNNPAFPAQWLYGLCRALLGDEFVFVTVASRIDDAPIPVGPDAPPLGLTVATTARTTRFCPYAAFSLPQGSMPHAHDL